MNQYKTPATNDNYDKQIAALNRAAQAQRAGMEVGTAGVLGQAVPVRPVESALNNLSARVDILTDRVDMLTDRLFRVLDVEPPTKAPDKPEPAPGNLAASIIREADLIGHLDCRIKSLLDRLQL